MHRVEHIGFAHTVQTRQAIQAGRKGQGLAFVVFKIAEFELGKKQGAVQLNGRRRYAHCGRAEKLKK